MFESCICIKPDEVLELLSRNERTARKEHECCECGWPINPGDRYTVEVAVFEGNLNTYKTCVACMRIRDSLFECGWLWGQMWESIHEQYCYLYDDDEDDEFCLCPGRPPKTLTKRT